MSDMSDIQTNSTIDIDAQDQARSIQAIKLDEIMTYQSFVLVEIPGDTSICPGDMVQVVRLDANGLVDIVDSTNWIVKQIKHTVTTDKYIQTLQLMK